MSSLAAALDAVSPASRLYIVERIAEWRRGSSEKWRRVASNIEAETALSVDDLTALLTDFAAELARGAEPPETSWVQVCRRAYQLRGPRVPDPIPQTLGRAVPLSTQAKVLSDSPAVHLSPDQCIALIQKIAMAGPSVKARDARVLRGALLGRYVLWATFCRDNPDDCPFQHLPRTRLGIRTALGLGDCPETETLVLMSYRTQGSHATLELFRPTIGDAEAYSWYRPHPLPEAPHGWTAPLEPNPLGLSPQPEVVHGETLAETLIFPIYLTV